MSRPLKIAMWSGLGVLAILALCVAVLLTFDWNRAKPWISSRVSDATGRDFAINGDLSLTWHAGNSWIPWPRLSARDVVFGNAEWARGEPHMLEAQQILFSVNPLPLLGKRIVIPSLSLAAPRLALERAEDGRNNWTFQRKNPEQPSEWDFVLQQLVLSRGEIHVLDAIKRIDMHADIDTLDGDTSGEYRIGWKLRGSFNGEKLSGEGKSGAVLALRDKSRPYPLQGEVKIGRSTIAAKGTLTEPAKLAALDLQLKFAGASMAQFYPIIGIVLPETPPFSTEGRLIGARGEQGGDWRYEDFSGKVGDSDLSGSLHYQAREPRPLVEGKVTSDYLNFGDLATLVGADSPENKAKRGEKNRQPADKVLPVGEFRTERWSSIDVDVQFSGRKIVRKEELPIDNLVTRINLKDGVLTLAPLKFGLAGGQLVSNLSLNGKSKPVKAEIRLSARHLKLDQLFPAVESMQASLGEINGDAALSATGNSISALMGSSNGEVKAVISEGTISKFLLEAMGLNVGSVVLTRLFGDKQVKLNCAAADFDVKKGLMQTRTFVVDTEDATIYVDGNIDLGKEQLALAIHPDSKGVRLISLRSPLYVRGTFKKPSVDIDKGTVALKAGSAIALSVLAPVAAALLPLVNVGPGEDSECARLLAKAQGKAEAPPPGKTKPAEK